MKGPGLIIALGKSKGSDSDKESESSSVEGFLEQAWDAFKADEKDNFLAAMKSAMRRCAGKKTYETSSDDEEESDDHDYDD